MEIKQKQIDCNKIKMMEEVGKYQSIQDRIKRLSKGQNQTTAQAINALEPTSTGKFQLPEDNRKQNTPQFTLSKKRQSNPPDYKALLGSMSPKVNTQSRLQTMTFGLPELSRDDFKQPALINRKSESEYLMQKSMRMSQQIRKTPREIPYLTKRNQNFDDISSLVNQKYSSKFTNDLYDSNEPKDKSLTFTYEAETLTKRREPTLESKRTYSNLTNRPGSSQYETPLVDRYRDIGDVRKREDPEMQRTASSTQQNSAARMLKKCRSGTFDRVPGKIVRNK